MASHSLSFFRRGTSSRKSNRQQFYRPVLLELESRLAPSTIPSPSHVVMVIEENKSYADIIGSSAAPYINSLANGPLAALLTQSYAITSGSTPNYFDLFSGSDQSGLSKPYKTPNLASELMGAGLTFGGYSENLPSVGYTGGSVNNYDKGHNPWVNFSNVPAADNMPLAGYFPSNFNNLPTVSFVIPDDLDDMHTGSSKASEISSGDSWLKTNLNSYVQWAKANNSLFILTWDEDSGSSNEHITTLFVGQMVQGGMYNETINHFNVLSTLEAMYGLPHAGASAQASPISDVWNAALTVSPTTLPVGTVNNAYSTTFTATGGSGSGYTFGESGTLPPGVTFAAGTLGGTPTQSGTFPITVTVHDSKGGSSSKSYSLVVDPAITLSSTTLATATVSNAYSQQLTVSGGSNSYSNLVVNGLPAGLSASLAGSTITISGTPTSASGSPFTVNVSVSDSQGGSGSKNYSLVVDPAIALSPTTLATATVGNAYSQQLTISGGSGSYSNLVVSVLPAGLSASLAGSTITISGTPTSASGSPFTVNVSVSDSQGGKGSKSYSLTVIDPNVITLSPTTLATATVGNAYSQQLTISGGSGSYSNLAVTGLPAGLSASLAGSTITISGTPTSGSGSPFTVNVSVSDSQGRNGSKSYSLVVDPAIAFSPTTLAAATVGNAYSQQLTVSGGSGSYSNLVVNGLPAGLGASLAGSTITISGTPTSASGSPFMVNVSVSDSQGGSGSRLYTLTVNAAVSATPSNFTATVVSATSVKLNWTESASNVTGFQILRSTDGVQFTQIGSVGSGVASYSDSGLTANTTYYYQVVATTGTGSAASSVISTLTAVPPPPSNLTATATSSTTVNLTWTDNSTNETGYKILRSTDGVNYAVIATVGAGITSYSDSGLSASTTYYYRVKSYNGVGTSASSNLATTVTTS